MYCFILLFNLFNSSTTAFTVTGSGTSILCNVRLTVLETFSAIVVIHRGPVKEFWKSVIIRQSYGQEFGVLFFIGPRYIYYAFLQHNINWKTRKYEF